MKKAILILSFLIGLGPIAFAQRNFKNGPKSPEQKAAKLTHKLQQKLNLSADQTTKVNDVLFAQVSRLDSLKNDFSTINPKSNQLARKDIMLTTDIKLNAILTPEQEKMYRDLKAERRQKMMAKRGSGTQTSN